MLLNRLGLKLLHELQTSDQEYLILASVDRTVSWAGLVGVQATEEASAPCVVPGSSISSRWTLLLKAG